MPRLLPLTAVAALACATALPAHADTASVQTRHSHSITTQYSDGAAETSDLGQVDAVATADPAEPPRRDWQILASDQTVRQALARWAATAGWTFGADQWELPFDLPLTANATFSADDFPSAALQVQDAVALTETPFRVCFYANQVLRVVPYNVACDRTTARSVR